MSVLNVYPTPITDALVSKQVDGWNEDVDPGIDLAMEQIAEFKDHAMTLERDCMTLALNLYGADYRTMAPETMEVMDRWRPRVKALLETVPI